MRTLSSTVGVGRAARFTTLVAILVAGSLAASAAAPVTRADAYDQNYNCETFVGQSTCNQTAGSWYSLTNVGGTNWSVTGDVCVAWGNLKSSTLQCATGGASTTLECAGSATYGYGWAGTQDGRDWNLSGHEDNYTSCS
jgi:hypothetical protein